MGSLKKRSVLALILSFLMLAAFIPASAGMVKVYEPNENVALGKPYTASKAFTVSPAVMGYQNIDGKELTDGIRCTDNDIYGSMWHGFDHRLESPIYVTVDLGAVTEGLVQFRLELVGTPDSGIDAPDGITISVSDDNKAFTVVGQCKKSKEQRVTDYVLTLATPVKARYVKAALGNPISGVFVFCSEFEIYNSKEVEKDESEVSKINDDEPYEENSREDVSDEAEKVGIVETKPLDTEKNKFEFKKGSRLTMQDGMILGAAPDDTPASIMKELKNVAGIRVNNEKGEEITTGKVYTGCTLAQYKNKEIETEYTIVILGTVKSEILADALSGKQQLEGALAMSADCDKNGVVNITDYIASKLVSMGKLTLDEKKVSSPEEWDMKFKKNSNSLYTMTCTAENGKIMTIDFDLKSWGTWNIGKYTVGGVTLAGTGTDWEYVFRAGETASGWVWSGGNHGNEKLLEMKFYNGISGEELIFDKNGKEFSIKNLVIVEKTHLHWGNADNYYAEVERRYTLAGQKITLDVTYDFVKDCYFGMSYTCMFPVPKTVGLYMDFLCDDGTQSKVVSLKKGDPSYNGAFYGKLASCASRYYGDKYPEYSFLVQIYTKNDSVENFKNADKLMYWDMNATHNKVYYTKFSNTGALTRVKTGTHWETCSSWELEINK